MHLPTGHQEPLSVPDRPPRPATRMASITNFCPLKCKNDEDEDGEPVIELDDLPALHNMSLSSLTMHDSWAADLSPKADRPPRIVTRIKSVDDETTAATPTTSPSSSSQQHQKSIFQISNIHQLPPLPKLPQIQLPAHRRGDLPPKPAVRMESCGAALPRPIGQQTTPTRTSASLDHIRLSD